MLLKYRQPNRLLGYNYSWNGLYFVTICTKDRVSYFGDIVDFEMRLNENGRMVEKQWLWLANQYPYIFLDEFVIMPNHFHGIIEIDETFHGQTNQIGVAVDTVGTGHDLSLQRTAIPPQKIKSLSEIIGAFKTTSSKLIHQTDLFDFAWQRSFHDHIIRDPESLEKIRLYIKNNPAKWHEDRNNPINIK